MTGRGCIHKNTEKPFIKQVKTHITMNYRNHIAAALLCAGLLTTPTLRAADINIIPTPMEMTEGQGTFTLTSATAIAWKGTGAEAVAKQFREKVARAAGFTLKKGKTDKAGTITFRIDAAVKGAEAYRLDVTAGKVVATASTADGLYYAMQSLLQLLPAEIEMAQSATHRSSWEIPAVSINDAPRFAYRGVMLDPCRHFLSVDAVKKQIERLAAYKFNRVHWHLTEDQGWRIEIKKYPELTQVGAQRVEGDGSIHRGYYTQEEVKDVVRFAAEHHVTIVPELEMPGHGMAAIAAYPWLSCKGEQMTPRIIWGVEDIVFCPGKETTYKFLEDVIDEMVPLFPGTLFHIGGDESPRGEWKTCDSCQSRMKAEGYEKEAQLQSYLIGRIGKYLDSKGKKLIGWDEILEGGNLDTSAVVMSWRGEDGGIAAARMGHHVLMTPSSRGLYFDQFQSDPATEPTAIGGYSTLKKVYDYDPVPQTLRDNGQERYVLGVQANCWSEYIPDVSTLELRLYPRALALAEAAWTPLDKKNYADFVRRVDGDASLRLKAKGVNFHIPIPAQAEGSHATVEFVDTATVTLTTPRPLRIVYTTDGTRPTANSATYTAPLTLTKTTTLRTASVLPSGVMSEPRTISVKKTDYAPAVRHAADTVPGVSLAIYKGNYLSPYALKGEPTTTKTTTGFQALRSQTRVPSSVRNVENYAAVAEGYINIPADGVYEFSSNNNQVWIDGKLLVDNAALKVPRFSPNNAEAALAKGLHTIRVVFLGGIFGGWPTYWDDAAVKMRPVGGKWAKVGPDMLFRTEKSAR